MVNNIILSHSYQSTYSVGNYITSLDYERGIDEWPLNINEATLNYYDKYEINQVTLEKA